MLQIGLDCPATSFCPDSSATQMVCLRPRSCVLAAIAFVPCPLFFRLYTPSPTICCFAVVNLGLLRPLLRPLRRPRRPRRPLRRPQRNFGAKVTSSPWPRGSSPPLADVQLLLLLLPPRRCGRWGEQGTQGGQQQRQQDDRRGRAAARDCALHLPGSRTVAASAGWAMRSHWAPPCWAARPSGPRSTRGPGYGPLDPVKSTGPVHG